MKLAKNLVFAGLLVFTLTVNTFAGDQQIPAATQPTPSPTPNALIAYEDGTSPLGYPCVDHTVNVTAETTDYLFFEALAALLSVY
ncbi:MAG TPA: hypothetical protein VFD62_03830 [Pyrinomonadaceae bacterium]|nr:hypothetical protein [Pyrinomonadaceae bacterium]